MAQEFNQPQETGSELRTQRMTAAESRAVIDLWQQEQVELTGLTDRPAVPDVAEGLDITVEDVQRLLTEVRVRRLEVERVLAIERELSKLRLAEGKRQLAEIQRQRAELRRQAEAERQRRVCKQTVAPQISFLKQEEPNEILLGFLPGFVGISFVVFAALLLSVITHTPLP